MVHEFYPLFEAFLVANMAYAGSDDFRLSIQKSILSKLDKYSKEEDENIQEKVRLTLLSLASYKDTDSFFELTKKDRKYLKKFNNRNVRWTRKAPETLLHGTRPIFFFTGLYCFFALLLGSLEASGMTDHLFACDSLWMTSVTIFWISFIIFISTFIIKFQNKKLSHLFSFPLFILIVCFSLIKANSNSESISTQSGEKAVIRDSLTSKVVSAQYTTSIDTIILQNSNSITQPQKNGTLTKIPTENKPALGLFNRITDKIKLMLELLFFVFISLLGFVAYFTRMAWNYIPVTLFRNRLMRKSNLCVVRIQSKMNSESNKAGS